MSTKLIVGLGNPERNYAGTRHNIGFMCVAQFGKEHGIKFDQKQGLARIGTGEIEGVSVVLARPQTHMNLSGESVCRLAKRFKVKLEDLVVIHDDLDLPLGRVRIRSGGSSGGHKGINSIIACMGNREFIRVRIGIGRPPGERSETKEDEIVDYVLSGFTREERQIIEPTISKVSDAIRCLITEGLEIAMNKFNQR